MITPPVGARILPATKPVGLHKGARSLAALAAGAPAADPFAGTVPVLRSRRAERTRTLLRDGSGLVLVCKPLEAAAFRWPAIVDGAVRLTPVEFAALFEGIAWRRVRALRAFPAPGVMRRHTARCAPLLEARARADARVAGVMRRRSGMNPAGCQGIVHCDGHDARKALAAGSEGITPAVCRNHARHGFIEPAKGKAAPIARETLPRIAGSCRAEAGLRGKAPDLRHAGWPRRSRPLVETLFAWLAEKRACRPPAPPRRPSARSARDAIRRGRWPWVGVKRYRTAGAAC